MKNISRRNFLKKAALCACGAVAAQAVPGLGVPTVRAATGNGTKVLFINMNGGWDGLAVLQPQSGALYSTLASLRPTLALNPASLLPVDATYGFHPQLTTFKSIYDEGKLAVVLNTGYQHMSRSHLESEIVFARGIQDRLSATQSGFITRMGTQFGWNSLQAVSVTGADRSFEGDSYRGTQVYSLSSLRFGSDYTQTTSESNFRRDMLYSVSEDVTPDPNKPYQGETKQNTSLLVNSVDTVRSAVQGATFTQAYPNTNMGRRFQDIDILFNTASLGSEVGYVRFGGFDTHSSQATLLNSSFAQFNAALNIFITNMKARGIWNNLIIAIYSEFGRTNRENGSQGTDHGGAIPFILMGGPVNGGINGTMTTSDLTTGGWLPMRYNLVEIYRRILAKMDYDPDQIFETPSGPTLPGLFS